MKDVLSVLRWADNPRNGIAAFRALQLMNGMGPANAQRCLDFQAAGGDLTQFDPPASTREHWPGFAALFNELSAPDAGWSGQMERACEWYRPILAQRFDDALVRAADLDMLASISGQFGSRERFKDDD